MLKAALNGERERGSHPALPLGAAELAADAAAYVRAGAAAIHIHPRDDDGWETLAADLGIEAGIWSVDDAERLAASVPGGKLELGEGSS